MLLGEEHRNSNTTDGVDLSVGYVYLYVVEITQRFKYERGVDLSVG